MIAPFLTQGALKQAPLLIRPIRKYSTMDRVERLVRKYPFYFETTGWAGVCIGGIVACRNINHLTADDSGHSTLSLLYKIPLNFMLVPLGRVLGPVFIPLAAVGMGCHSLLNEIKKRQE